MCTHRIARCDILQYIPIILECRRWKGQPNATQRITAINASAVVYTVRIVDAYAPLF